VVADVVNDRRSAHVEFYEDVAGEWRFRVRAANGQIVADSESYRDEHDARRGFDDMVATLGAFTGHDEAV